MTSPHQQKLRITGPVVITANRLTDGIVVHRASNGLWVERLEEAEVLTDATAAQAALSAASADGRNAVGPYVAPIGKHNVTLEPGNLRERIREYGPTFAVPADTPLARP